MPLKPPKSSYAMSSAARPVAMRMRPDLVVRKVSMRGRPQWSIKDPLALRFFQLREEEYFVLRLLDGHTSQDGIRTRFEREFAPRRLEPLRLQAYLGMLHRNGLVVSDSPGQGEELLERRGRLIREAWLEGFVNLSGAAAARHRSESVSGLAGAEMPLDVFARDGGDLHFAGPGRRDAGGGAFQHARSPAARFSGVF